MSSRGNYGYLAKNIGLLTLSNFANKILGFFLVPLYTSVLSTTDYGVYDMFNTTILLLTPIITLNIMESVLRFSMDEKFSKDGIVNTSLRIYICSVFFIAILLIINHLCQVSKIIDKYAVFFLFMFIVQSFVGIITYYARGNNCIVILSVSSVISSSVIIILNIVFLLGFKWGLKGYFLANIIGTGTQCVYLLLRLDYISNIHINVDFRNERIEMIRYSKPLIANSIGYWINSAADKYVVILFSGMASNGVYSVASKIPSILNVFQSIFAQAWTLSVVKDYDPDDKNGFFRTTYNIYNAMMVIVCSLLILGDKVLAKTLYAKDFYGAWRYAPFLTIAIVFSSMSGYLGGFFSAVKDSKIFAQSTMIGAGINIILNLILTPIMGPIGAAIATTVSFGAIWFVRLSSSKRYIKLEIKLNRDLLAYAILIIQSVTINIIEDNVILYMSESVMVAIIVLLFTKELKSMILKVKLRLLK